MNGGPIHILLVDDHAVVRETLAERLHAEPGMLVVGQADNADDALRLTHEHRPHIVLMDIDMPGLSPFSAAASIAASLADTRVIFLSAFTHDTYVEQALQAKAWGYVAKHESYAQVCQAIRDVAAGTVHFSADIQSRIISSSKGLGLAPEATTRAAKLTQREMELLRYLAHGLSTNDIARTMHISPKTVNSHKTHLMGKLGLHNRVDLARYAFREGLATL